MGKHNKISGQFAARLIEMMESPAYRVLSLSAHRVLSRIEIEWAHHGGQDNGQLPVTFDDFAEYGVHRTAIGPALYELESLGFIVITEKGKMARAADYRRPNKFLLTSRPTNKGADPLHKWKRFKTMEEAEAVAEASRKLSAEKKKSPVRKTYRKPVRKTYQKAQIASTENVPLSRSETVPLSISRVGAPHLGKGNRAGPTRATAADPPPLGRLPPPPAPPSPAVIWATFSPSRPRQPSGVGTVSPRKPAPDVIVEPIDVSYLIGNRRIEIRDQTARRKVDALAPHPSTPALVN
jgi:hypothetical protein